MDKWQELTIEVNREVEEAASNILIESGSQGVAIDDSADYLENADRFGELYPEVEQVETVKITAYYPESADIEAITKQVNERLAELTDLVLKREIFTWLLKSWLKKIGLRIGKNTMNQHELPMI